MKCLEIVGRSKVKEAIKSRQPECVISIKDIAKKFEHHAWTFEGPKLLLEFEDWENDQPGSPTEKDVQKIIDFAINLKGKTFTVNCEAGISRSSATAIICQHIGGKPVESNFEELTERFVNIFPNQKIITLASDILNDKSLTEEYTKWQTFWMARFKKRFYTGYYP